MGLKEAIEIAENVDLTILTHSQIEAFCTLIDHAKKSIEPLEGEAMVGRKGRILQMVYGHPFEIGQIVEVIKYDINDNVLPYKVKDNVFHSWVSDREFELIDSE